MKIKLSKVSYNKKNHQALIKQFEEKKKENQLYLDALNYTYNTIKTYFSKSTQEYFLNIINCIQTYIENTFNKSRWFK